MKYFNLFVVMVIVCAFQWNVVSAKKGVVVNFASDAGQLNLYNEERNINDISECRLDLTNKNIICHAYYQKAIKTCDEPLCGSARYYIDYDLRMPVTKFTGSSCKLANGTTFKSSKLMAKNKNNKWAQAQSLANYQIIIEDYTPYLPKTMTPSSSQRFDFITKSGCKFSAYYDKVEPYNMDMKATA